MDGFNLFESETVFFQLILLIKMQMHIIRTTINRNQFTNVIIDFLLNLECINFHIPSTKSPTELNSKSYVGESVVIYVDISEELHTLSCP